MPIHFNVSFLSIISSGILAVYFSCITPPKESKLEIIVDWRKNSQAAILNTYLIVYHLKELKKDPTITEDCLKRITVSDSFGSSLNPQIMRYAVESKCLPGYILYTVDTVHHTLIRTEQGNSTRNCLDKY